MSLYAYHRALVPSATPFSPGSAQVDELSQKGIIEGLELQIKKKDGTSGYVEINASPIITRGKTEGIQGIVRDVGYRKEAEKIIQSQHILTDAILDSVTESVFLIKYSQRRGYEEAFFDTDAVSRLNINRHGNRGW